MASPASGTRAPRPVPGWLLAAALAVPLAGLNSPLIEIDDARYAEVPRAMAASGDWVLPSLNGMPYVEKPPLWYWSSAASQRLLGSNEAAARLPMALFALLGACAAWWLGSWLFKPETGRVAALATATATLWVFLSHNMTLDMPLSALLAWTTAFALRVLERPGDARWAAPAAWGAAALAFLAKGLIAVLLPAAWVIGLAVLFPRWRAGALKLLSPAALALFAAIAAPWFLALQERRPDFLHTFFVEQHFQRYLTPKYSRHAPWWFFLVIVPSCLMPWTVPFLAGLARVVRAPLERREDAALVAWIAGVTLFFSLSSSKLATYSLPVFPHAALLAAVALERGLPAWAERLGRALGGLLLAGAAAALYAALAGLPASVRVPPGLEPGLLRIVGLLLAGLLAAYGAAQWARLAPGRRAFALGLGGALAGVLLMAGLRAAAPLTSAKAVSAAIREEARPGDRLWTYGCYLHGLPFYTGRLVDKLVYFVGEFHYAKREEAHAARFGDDNDARALRTMPGRTFVVLRSFERPHFESQVAGARTNWREFGPWTLALVEPR